MDYWFKAEFKTADGNLRYEYIRVTSYHKLSNGNLYEEAEVQAKIIAFNEDLIFISTKRIKNPTKQ